LSKKKEFDVLCVTVCDREALDNAHTLAQLRLRSDNGPGTDDGCHGILRSVFVEFHTIAQSIRSTMASQRHAEQASDTLCSSNDGLDAPLT
jgi:hypothetical protein